MKPPADRRLDTSGAGIDLPAPARPRYGLRYPLVQANAEQVRFNLADLRYRNGAASYLDVLDAQRSLFTAQQAVVQVQAAQVQNLVTLYKALGGGWTEPAEAK